MKITLIFALFAQIAGGITAPAEVPEAEEKTFYCEYHGEFEPIYDFGAVVEDFGDVCENALTDEIFTKCPDCGGYYIERENNNVIN